MKKKVSRSFSVLLSGSLDIETRKEAISELNKLNGCPDGRFPTELTAEHRKGVELLDSRKIEVQAEVVIHPDGSLEVLSLKKPKHRPTPAPTREERELNAILNERFKSTLGKGK